MKVLKVLVIVLLATFSCEVASAQVKHHHKKPHHHYVKHHHKMVKHR